MGELQKLLSDASFTEERSQFENAFAMRALDYHLSLAADEASEPWGISTMPDFKHVLGKTKKMPSRSMLAKPRSYA